MGKKLLHTPYSRIVAVLRGRIWLWSRERAEVVKRCKGVCEECGEDVGRSKIEVHHIDGADIERIVSVIRECLLHDPSRLKGLCKKCHGEETNG